MTQQVMRAHGPEAGADCLNELLGKQWTAGPRWRGRRAAGAVAHVAAHELGAAAYAIKAARAAAPEGEGEAAGRLGCKWQRDQLPVEIRELVLDNQRLRNDICWSVFDY